MMSFEPGSIEAMPIGFRLHRIVREIGEFSVASLQLDAQRLESSGPVASCGGNATPGGASAWAEGRALGGREWGNVPEIYATL